MSQLIMMPKLQKGNGMGRRLLLYLTGVNNSVQPQKVTQLPPQTTRKNYAGCENYGKLRCLS